MTKKELDIQNISTKWTDFQAGHVLLLGQVTEKKENTNSSHFLKFLFPNLQYAYLALPDTQVNALNQKVLERDLEIFPKLFTKNIFELCTYTVQINLTFASSIRK